MAPLLESSKDPTKAMSLETLMGCSKDPHLGLSMDLMTAPLLEGLKDSMTAMGLEAWKDSRFRVLDYLLGSVPREANVQ